VNDELLLSVQGLSTYFHLRDGVLKAVHNISFDVKKGTVLGIVGESGCGKSITARSVLRMVKKPGSSTGKILFNDDGNVTDLVSLDPVGDEIRKIRGDKISMIFQEPMNSLSPVHTIGNQVTEGIMLHLGLEKEQARDRAIELLADVGISDPKQRIDSYPHQLSGGMRQRAMIAIAISCNPYLLLADEPTTALDVSVQAQILKLLKDLQGEYNMSIIFITHDLAVVAQMAERVLVMYLGQEMEEADVEDIFYEPLHPYTEKLLESMPDLSRRRRNERLEIIQGSVPEPINLPDRCVFHDRCHRVIKGTCDKGTPQLYTPKPGHRVRCFIYA
jgi:peptide/nickel transport system ATP-binding protein